MSSPWRNDYMDNVRKVLKGGSMVELNGRIDSAVKAGWTIISPVREVGGHGDRYQVLCEYDNKRGQKNGEL